MLELTSLHITAWTQTDLKDARGVWVRHIQGSTANPVGFVRLAGEVRTWWFAWLQSVRMEVYETEDASHLMSLVRAWGMLQRWDVYDAEERRIGSVYPPSLIDSNGEQRGTLELQANEGKIADPAGHILASFRRHKSADLEVHFPEERNVNPFLRMLLLATVLTLDPLPQ